MMPLDDPFQGNIKPGKDEEEGQVDDPLSVSAGEIGEQQPESKMLTQEGTLDDPFGPTLSGGKKEKGNVEVKEKTSIPPASIGELETRSVFPDMSEPVNDAAIKEMVENDNGLSIGGAISSWMTGPTHQVASGVAQGVHATALRSLSFLSEKTADILGSAQAELPKMPSGNGIMTPNDRMRQWKELAVKSQREAVKQHGLTKTTERFDQELRELVEQEGVTPLEGISRDLTRFMIPYLTFSKALGPGKFRKNYVAGPLADMAAFTGDEQRLSNLVADMDVPVLSEAADQYMAADKDDPEALSKFKQAVEGVALGKLTDFGIGVFGGVISAARGVRSKIKGEQMGMNPEQQSMPLNTPKGWAMEEVDVTSSTEARKILGEDLEIAQGQEPSVAAAEMYIRNMKNSGVWHRLDKDDRMAKLTWLREQVKSTHDSSGKVKPKKKAEGEDEFLSERFNQEWEKNRQAVREFRENMRKPSAKGILESLEKSLVDRSGPLRRKLLKTPEGREAERKFALAAGASAKSSRDADIAVKEVYHRKIPGVPASKEIGAQEKDNLDKLIMLRRFRTIKSYNPKWSEKGNPLTSRKPEFYSQEIDRMREQLGEESFADLNRRADTFFQNIVKPLDDLLDSGTISRDEWKKLSRFSYAPIKWIEELDKPIAQLRSADGRAISVNRSGIEKLDKGSKKLLDTDTRPFLEEAIMRSNSISAKNRANQSLMQLAKSGKSDEVVRLKKPSQKDKNNWVKIEVMEEGEPQNMYLATEYADQWAASPSVLNDTAKSILQGASLSPVTRFFATGPGNPEFALSNFPRDTMYNILVSDQYSGFVPFATRQYAEDISEVMPDAVMRKGSYKDFVNEGGAMEFLSQQGVPGRGQGAHTSKGEVEDAMAYFNTTSEVINRLAVRNRALKNLRKQEAKRLGIPLQKVSTTKEMQEEATYIARTTIDFDQGGKVSKGINEGVPYFNAAAQGIRGYARSWKNNPTKAAAYAGQLMSIYAGMHVANRTMQPEGTADTPKYIKDNFVTATTPFSFTDEEGDRRHLGVRMPVDHSSVGLKIAAEALVDRAMNDGTPTDVEIDAMDRTRRFLSSQFGIVPGVTMPPLISALVSYKGDYNWWKDSPVWTGEQNIPNRMKYTEETSEVFRDAGNVFDLSPANLEDAVGQVVPSNIFSLGMGAAYKSLTKDLPRDQLDPLEKSMVEEMREIPGLRRFLYLTSPHSKEADRLEESINEGNAETVQMNRNVDNLSQKVIQGDISMQDASSWIDNNAPQELAPKGTERLVNSVAVDRTISSIGYEQATTYLPSHRWWKRLANASPSAKAKEFALHLSSVDNMADGEEKKKAKRLFSAMKTQVPGFDAKKSPEFGIYLKRELERQGLNPSTVLN